MIGAVERGGKVTAKATDKTKLRGYHLRAFVRERVSTSSAALITDEYKGYLGMDKVLPMEAQAAFDQTINRGLGVTA